MALYNHLFAKKHGGKWLLRLEDTDTASFDAFSIRVRYLTVADALCPRLY